MRLPTKSKMDWKSLTAKLIKGVALVDRQEKAEQAANRSVNFERAGIAAARAAGELGDFGQAGIMEQLQSGELFPDQIAGFSTKTVLAVVVALLLFKLKKGA